MAKGLPKWAIKEAKRRGAKNIFAYAWTLVKRKKRPSRSRKVTRRKKSNPSRSVRRTARRKKRRGGKSLQRTVFKWMRVGALVAPGAAIAIQKKSGQAKLEEAVEAYFGYNIPQHKMVWGSLLRGWGPFLAATLVTYGIPKIAGILRKL